MKAMKKFWVVLSICCLIIVTLPALSLYAQETTGGLQGTVKDPSGAVVPRAHVVVTGTALVGSKEQNTDGSGYYRFANLPPGDYTITVTAKGFSTAKEVVALAVGHLPTVNFALTVGTENVVVEVTGTAPVIDVTTNRTMTNVTQDVIENVPHGYSFQSVIQLAPMARNEPLAGGSMNMGIGGTGGGPPGSSGNGLAYGFSIGGAADSENSFLVEGQDTENISGGATQANVPFQFIQEVQVKTSGIEAEHGGALGGVVNVIMKKGSNAFHGSGFATYEADGLDGSANGTLRYDPAGPPTPPAGSLSLDPAAQTYLPKRDHFRNMQPGFTIGGPIVNDRLWFFLGFAPQYTSRGRTVNFTPSTTPGNSGLGNQLFNQDNQTYFSTARLDATVTQKIRVFGSWLYQYSRESGVSLPNQDSVNNLLNNSINTPVSQFAHGIGYSAPNATYNVGADITLTPKIVATTRFGYFFNNYHDFGWPTSGVDLQYNAGGLGQVDNLGNPLPGAPGAGLNVPNGTTTAPFNSTFTEVNASKHYQLNQDVAFFKSGWGGTHNFKVGYQLNHLSNVINQHGSVPFAFMFVGQGLSYGAATQFGSTNCGLLKAAYPVAPPGKPACAGQFGFVVVQDFATVLKTTSGTVAPAVDWNHGFFAQDAWTVGHGLTFNLGLRVEKESLPAPSGIGISSIRTIDFGWADKIAPRLGVAWDPTGKGTMKIFGSYGVVNDVMKLLLAQTSWGAQGFEQCAYALGPNGSGGFNNSDINLAFNSALRACPTGVANVGANFVGGTVPQVLTDARSGVGLIENVNFRPEEPVVPGLKPYRQHEYVAGVDYRINKNYAFEARYDHRALDHVIEDASLADPNAFEIFNIVNPGEGVNKTIDSYAKYLTSLGHAYGPGTAAFNPVPPTDPAAFGTCPTCPPNPKAIRTYDGVELRVNKSMSNGWLGSWAGNVSYTWSRLYGNYTGLTTTEQTDGGITGRNSPDTTRAFDEPLYYFGANGQSNNGPLPTDRPNTFKGNVYYQLPWRGKRMATTIGLFQQAYQGSPVSSWADVGLGVGSPIEGTFLFGRGKWVDATRDATGNIVLGAPRDRRTPWFTQTDLNLAHSIKVNSNNEAQELTFNATFLNVLNQHAVTAYWAGFNSDFFPNALFQGQIFNGATFYKTVESGYNAQTQAVNDGVILHSQYGQPNLWQLSRSIRLGVNFRF